ncbi:MAG TPA: SurA N-terminal domain-containing protein [Syntrophorhabdaceae bacterium]|nr:SurA N-terminal domain-containing protein [Syntrophorhabdaceae bacterium]
MLKFMRKHATSWMIKVFFGMIIVSFIGLYGYGRLTDRENVKAKVGPYKVSGNEYQEAYTKQLDFYRMLLRDKLDEKTLKDLNLEKKVMDGLIDKYVLLVKADEMGITVSDEEFTEYLKSVPAFQRDGAFNREQYLAVLASQNIDPDKFEKDWKRDRVAQKVAAVIQDTGTFASESDVWAGYVKDKGKINLAYAEFDPAVFKDKVNVTDKELQDLYEKEKGAYRAENTYRLKELVVDTTGQLKDDAIYMDLLKVKDMDAYARDKGLSVTDLGNVKEGELVKRFKTLKIEEWLKGLRKGDISLPVREGGKSYIFQLVDVEEGKPFDKNSVIAKIKERVVKEKSGDMAKLAAEDAVKSKTLAGRHETGFIARGSQSIPGIGEIPQEFRSGIFSLSPSNTVYDKPLEISGKYYVFSYKDEKTPDKAEWDRDRQSYTKYFAATNQSDFFKSFLAEMRAKVKITYEAKEQ